jgi:hypothetical protein
VVVRTLAQRGNEPSCLREVPLARAARPLFRLPAPIARTTRRHRRLFIVVAAILPSSSMDEMNPTKGGAGSSVDER